MNNILQLYPPLLSHPLHLPLLSVPSAFMSFYISTLFACMHMLCLCLCVCVRAHACVSMCVYECHVSACAQRGKTKQRVLYPVQKNIASCCQPPEANPDPLQTEHVFLSAKPSL